MKTFLCVLLVCLSVKAEPFMIDDPAWSAKPSQNAPVAWLTGLTGGNTRNDYTGKVGLRFTPSSNITVTALGRWIVSGNNQSHALYLYATSSCATPLATVTLLTSGASAGSVAYTNLAVTVNLTAGVQYAVVSQEVSGGDLWYDNAPVTHTSITGPASRFNGQSCSGVAETNIAFVPTSFKYTQ